VINAALALAAKPNSKVAQDNMDLFKDQWEKQVSLNRAFPFIRPSKA